jgi:hypothetical protein
MKSIIGNFLDTTFKIFSAAVTTGPFCVHLSSEYPDIYLIQTVHSKSV